MWNEEIQPGKSIPRKFDDGRRAKQAPERENFHGPHKEF